MELHKTVIDFINHFTDRGRRHEVIDTFTNGCCYWFAEILWQRFYFDKDVNECEVVYDPLINHWACQINGKIYDIRGDITTHLVYSWEKWEECEKIDELEIARLYRDYINFKENENA